MATIPDSHPITTLKTNLFIALVLILGLCLGGCSSCHQQTATIATDITVPIKDPWLKKLAGVSKTLSVKASGGLKPGKISFKNKQIEIAPDTTFEIDTRLFINGQPTIATNSASGALKLSREIQIDKVPMPTRIELHDGKATVEMDFARAIMALLVNRLQSQSQASESPAGLDALIDLPSEVSIQKASIDFQPKAKLPVPGLTANIGDGSYIELSNAKFSSLSDFEGDMDICFKLDKGSEFIMEEVICKLANCAIDFKTKFQCKGGNFSAVAAQDKDSCTISATDCLVQSDPLRPQKSTKTASPNKIDATCSNIKLGATKLALSRQANQEPRIDLEGNISTSQAKFDLSDGSQSVAGQISPTDGLFKYSTDGEKVDASLLIDKQIAARDLVLKSAKGGDSFELQLREASIAHLSAGAKTGLTMKLNAAAIKPRLINWHGKGAHVEVSLDKAASIETNAPLELYLKNQEVVIPTLVPVSIHAGSITVRDAKKNKFLLKDVGGKCQIGVDEAGPRLACDVTMKLSSNSNLFGIHGFNANFQRIKVDCQKQHLDMQLVNGSILIPTNDLKVLVNRNLKDPMVVPINETLLQQKKWRYRNFHIKKVTVTKPVINSLNFQGVNEISVKAAANLALEGTVEVYHQKLNPLSKESSQWKEHPWSAAAAIQESGVIDYKLIQGQTLKDSKIHLDTKLQVGYPDKIDLDWSKVGGDVLAKAENQLLKTAISGAKMFTQNKSIPINTSIDLPLFKSLDDRLRQIRVKSLVIQPQGKDLSIKLNGAASF